jgi:hypothetical protein
MVDLEDGLYAKIEQTRDIIVALDYTKAPMKRQTKSNKDTGQLSCRQMA